MADASRSRPPARSRACSTRSSPPASGVLGAGRACAGCERAADGARAAVADYRTWLESTLADGTDDWALGRERYDELVGLRAFDGLDADAILAIGEEQLALNRAARVAAAREIDPTVDEPTVVDRIKSDHPATFAAALDAYRDVMVRARQHLIERDIVTVPDDERIEVIPTPEYIRNVIPFAAYFDPPKFDTDPNGHLHRHAVGRRRPERDARAQLQLDQQHQHPRGVPGPPPPAVGRRQAPEPDPGARRTPPSSSRAGGCTPSR